MALDEDETVSVGGNGGGTGNNATRPSSNGPSSTPSLSLKMSVVNACYGDREGLRRPSQEHLELKSPVRPLTSFFYKWPLKKGKGSMRRSEVRKELLSVLGQG